MEASAKLMNARISFKDSVIVCKQIKRKKLIKAHNFLQNLINQKKSIKGKYYTNASKKILEVLKTVEANAKQKNLDSDKLFIKKIKADKAFKYLRPKSRFKFRGREAKMTNIEVVVEER